MEQLEMEGTKVVEQVRVDMPEQNKESVELFINEHAEQTGKGWKTLLHNLQRYIMHDHLSNQAWNDAVGNAQYINGEKGRRGQPTEEKLMEKNARAFFSSLAGEQITAQCKVYGVDRFAYETVDQIVDALVQTQVATLNGHK